MILILLPILGALLGALALITVIWQLRQFISAKAEAHSHLETQGYKQVCLKRSFISSGPFPASGANHQPIFRFTAIDRAANPISGWLLFPQAPYPPEIQKD